MIETLTRKIRFHSPASGYAVPFPSPTSDCEFYLPSRTPRNTVYLTPSTSSSYSMIEGFDQAKFSVILYFSVTQSIFMVNCRGYNNFVGVMTTAAATTKFYRFHVRQAELHCFTSWNCRASTHQLFTVCLSREKNSLSWINSAETKTSLNCKLEKGNSAICNNNVKHSVLYVIFEMEIYLLGA